MAQGIVNGIVSVKDEAVSMSEEKLMPRERHKSVSMLVVASVLHLSGEYANASPAANRNPFNRIIITFAATANLGSDLQEDMINNLCYSIRSECVVVTSPY